ncbi:hypothetical protein [Kineosporia mesophila]|nr:hypothetical protein [Kineosporia mesophila]MCD5353932.1 hypothetical protein [Kineosporia mesophila]
MVVVRLGDARTAAGVVLPLTRIGIMHDPQVVLPRPWLGGRRAGLP